VNPWIGLAVVHPEQPPLHHLEGRGVQVGQDTPQPLRGRWQRTVLIDGLPAGRARLPSEAPPGHMGLKGGRKRRDHAPQLIQGQTGRIQHLERAGLEVGESSIPPGGGLLSLEAKDIINRNNLYYTLHCPDNLVQKHSLAEIIDVFQGSGLDGEAAAHRVTCTRTRRVPRGVCYATTGTKGAARGAAPNH
jgi:hypothetical protein